MQIEQAILSEAIRLIQRHERIGRELADEHDRRANRSTGAVPRPKLRRPPEWRAHNGFNPYITRAQVTPIAYSVRGALRDRRYRPRHPYARLVPKPSGEMRTVCVYQVADSAISKMIFDNALEKNLPLLSGRSYAYRADRSAQNAIQYIKSEFERHDRLYVAEYDFSKYFESISHDHVRRTLHDRFFLTDVEKQAIESFLQVDVCSPDNYVSTGGPIREIGIPQGTSISLLLANAAAWELDRELENTGVGFVRYADDTLIWSTDYGRLSQAVEQLHGHATLMGVRVNTDKSPGVSLLVPKDVEGEMRSKDAVSYLGHDVGLDVTGIRQEGLERIQARIDVLIFNTLLREPLAGTQNGARLSPTVDRDYVMIIWRLRRYLYGDLNEKDLRRFQQGGAPLRRFKGVMAAYPLIDDTQVLQEVDRWLLDRLWLAVRKRGRLLNSAGVRELPAPHGVTRARLRWLQGVSSTTGDPLDLTVPSTKRIADVLTAASQRHGPARIGQPTPY
jgi:hypothetical protein